VVGLRLEGNIVTDCFSVETTTVRFARFTVFPYFSCSEKSKAGDQKMEEIKEP